MHMPIHHFIVQFQCGVYQFGGFVIRWKHRSMGVTGTDSVDVIIYLRGFQTSREDVVDSFTETTEEEVSRCRLPVPIIGMVASSLSSSVSLLPVNSLLTILLFTYMWLIWRRTVQRSGSLILKEMGTPDSVMVPTSQVGPL